MIKNTITIRKEQCGYVAKYEGDAAGEIIRLFGADTIPTAFTAQAEPSKVMAEIRRLNPGSVVRMKGGAL